MAQHKKMSPEMRAKQFIPFAALTGLEEALTLKEKEHEDNTIDYKNITKSNEIINSILTLKRKEAMQLKITIEEENGLRNISCNNNDINIDDSKVIIKNFYFNINQIIQIKILS